MIFTSRAQELKLTVLPSTFIMDGDIATPLVDFVKARLGDFIVAKSFAAYKDTSTPKSREMGQAIASYYFDAYYLTCGKPKDFEEAEDNAEDRASVYVLPNDAIVLEWETGDVDLLVKI